VRFNVSVFIRRRVMEWNKVQKYLIYADNYITWNDELGDWNHNDEYTGTRWDAYAYADKKYGKKYNMESELKVKESYLRRKRNESRV
jgi:hypothetical protein